MSEQKTLAEATVSHAAENVASEKQVTQTLKTASSLAYPTYDDPTYDVYAWKRFIENTTSVTAVTAARKTQSSPEQEALWAIAMLKSGEQSLIDKAITFNVEQGVSESRENAIKQLSYHSIHRLPAHISVPLATWIRGVLIVSSTTLKRLCNNRNGGYYHPTEHFIAVSTESAWASPDGWPLSKPGCIERYEHSNTIHEFGHALHYMLGVQDENTEELDNTTREEWVVELRNTPQTQIGLEFEKLVRNGYSNLEKGQTQPLSTLHERQKTTIEEYIAEGFSAWVTSPMYLKQRQPNLYEAFKCL